MADFLGYFIKATKTGKTFPNKYIDYESYVCTPNQREEIKAYREDNSRDLYRVTADGMKTKITFTIRGNLHKKDKKAILAFFTDAEAKASDPATAKKQRKVELTYWNDEDDKYETGFFYRPNMDFNVKQIKPTKKKTSSGDTIYDIIYKDMSMELIEY